MRILVTGGAGYIGSVMTDVLIDSGHHVGVIDNLQRGHRDAVRSEAVFVEADLQNKEKIVSTLKAERIEAVIHMAGDALVGESMQNPENITGPTSSPGSRCSSDAPGGRPRHRVFVNVRRLRRAGQGTHRGDHSNKTGESLRRLKAHVRARAWLVPCRTRVPGGVAALLQRRRRERALRASATSRKRI